MDQNLRPLQLSYLRYYYYHRGLRRSVTALSKAFGVSKSAVSQMNAVLVNMGLVDADGGNMALTKKGASLIAKYVKPAEEIAVLYRRFGLSDKAAGEEAFRTVAGSSLEIAGKLADYLYLERILSKVAGSRCESLEALPCGNYPVQVHLFIPGTSSLSMGNRGFKGDARLVAGPGSAGLVLTSKTVAYKEFRGTLKSLSYMQNGQWREAISDVKREWVIPCDAMEYVNSGDGLEKLTARVRAEATVPEMPVSVSDLCVSVFDLSKFFCRAVSYK
jgi:Mn-dependent DtxR family transcriptional regulator